MEFRHVYDSPYAEERYHLGETDPTVPQWAQAFYQSMALAATLIGFLIVTELLLFIGLIPDDTEWEWLNNVLLIYGCIRALYERLQSNHWIYPWEEEGPSCNLSPNRYTWLRA